MTTPSPALRAKLDGLARSRGILDLLAKIVAPPKGAAPPPRVIHLALLWGIGDAVTALPLIHAIKRKWPAARLVLLGKAWLCDLFADEGTEFGTLEAPWTAFSGKYRLWDRSWRRFARQLAAIRRRPADLWINFRLDPRDVILARCSGARSIAGFSAAGAGRWLAYDFPVDAESFLKLYSGAVAAGLAQAITGERPAAIPEFANLPPRTRDRRRVIVAFGASHPIRRWDPAKIACVVDGLRGRGLDVTTIDESWRGGLNDLKAAIAQADLFVGADSGPLHIASALNVPTIAVFGPGSLDRFAPRRISDRALAEPIACRPCFDQCPYATPLCLDRLEPAGVLAEIDALLST